MTAGQQPAGPSHPGPSHPGQAPADEQVVIVATAADMTRLGRRLATVLAAGDLVVLSGALGAGKTTLAQGIGQGLGVRGPVTSPTFVIARVHPSLARGPALVHADAYRLGGRAELDDLDLDADLATSVTVVEWGEGLAEILADSYLAIRIEAAPPVPAGADGARPARHAMMDGDQVRTVTVTGRGGRWQAAGPELGRALTG